MARGLAYHVPDGPRSASTEVQRLTLSQSARGLQRCRADVVNEKRVNEGSLRSRDMEFSCSLPSGLDYFRDQPPSVIVRAERVVEPKNGAPFKPFHPCEMANIPLTCPLRDRVGQGGAN